MRCALSVAVVFLALGFPPSAGEAADRPGLMLNLTFPDRLAVGRAIELALARLDRPGCSRIFADFTLPDGRSPRSELDRLGIEPESLVRSLVFVDGSWDPVCRNGRAVLTTTPGSRVIRVCAGFSRLRDVGLTACLVLHESLHALGLGENPPSSAEITQRVDRRCS